MSKVLLLAAALAVACGSVSQSGGTGSGGTYGNDGGSGGSVDGGTSSGGGGSDGGGLGAGGSDGGTSSGGGGGSGGGGSGGGTDGGTVASSDCDGIVPDSIGNSFSFDVPPPSSGTMQCDSASSDEEGNLIADNRAPPATNLSWELYSPEGAHVGHIEAVSVFPQGPGWEGIYWRDTHFGPPSPSLGYWLPDGTLQQHDDAVGSDEAGPQVFRSWPNGVVVATQSCAAGPAGNLTVRRFDSTGHLTSSGDVQYDCDFLAAVGDANVSTLLLWRSGSSPSDIVASWLDSAGSRITGFFTIGTGVLGKGSRVLLHALVGGGAVLAIDGVWKWFIGSGSADVSAAPDWLASHAGHDFTIVRGERAYALLPRTSGDPRVMDLISTQGNHCGSLTFPVGGLTTGADGSVIGASGNNGCTKTVWPGLLR
jgi:hypothetical protein